MRTLDVPKTTQSLIRFIKTTVVNAGFAQVVVALSGGVDSSTTVTLAVKALRKENIHVLLLPYKDWHEEATAHAKLLVKKLQISKTQVYIVDIAPMVDAFMKRSTISNQQLTINQLRLGNIMARVRMIVLYDFAKKLNALVLGTENKSEHFLGYYTRFGDEASDIEPLRELYKTEIFELARYLGIPKEIITKGPTAGLWHGQTDEAEFGFTYKEADEVLYGLFEVKVAREVLINQGIKPDVIEKVAAWVKKVDFKHHLPLLAPPPKRSSLNQAS